MMMTWERKRENKRKEKDPHQKWGAKRKEYDRCFCKVGIPLLRHILIRTELDWGFEDTKKHQPKQNLISSPQGSDSMAKSIWQKLVQGESLGKRLRCIHKHRSAAPLTDSAPFYLSLFISVFAWALPHNCLMAWPDLTIIMDEQLVSTISSALRWTLLDFPPDTWKLPGRINYQHLTLVRGEKKSSWLPRENTAITQMETFLMPTCRAFQTWKIHPAVGRTGLV